MGVGQIVVGWLGWRSCWGGRVIDGYIGGSRDTGRAKRGVYELLIVYGDALPSLLSQRWREFWVPLIADAL